MRHIIKLLDQFFEAIVACGLIAVFAMFIADIIITIGARR